MIKDLFGLFSALFIGFIFWECIITFGFIQTLFVCCIMSFIYNEFKYGL